MTLDVGSARCPARIIGYDYDATISSATSFASPPSGATAVIVQAETASVRVTTDGTTPTATVGLLVPVGEPVVLTADIAGLKALSATGAISLTYLSW